MRQKLGVILAPTSQESPLCRVSVVHPCGAVRGSLISVCRGRNTDSPNKNRPFIPYMALGTIALEQRGMISRVCQIRHIFCMVYSYKAHERELPQRRYLTASPTMTKISR